MLRGTRETWATSTPACGVHFAPAMNPNKRTEYLTRDRLMKLLADDEVASVSTAETKAFLANGAEYLDLEKLELGVLHASATTGSLSNVLPRKAVHENTWKKLVAQLDPIHRNGAHPTA